MVTRNILYFHGVDPVASMVAIENKQLIAIAEDIKSKLERVIASL